MLTASRSYWCYLVLFLIAFQLMNIESATASKLSDEEKTTLVRSVTLAMSHHPRILSARQELSIKESELDMIRSDWLPRLKFRAGVGREDSNNASTRALTGKGSDEYERRESSLFLRQVVYDGNETILRKHSKNNELEAARLQLKLIENEVALNAAEAHLSFIKANEVLTYHLESLEAHRKIAQNVERRVRSGKDDLAKLNQVSARLALVLANVENARRSRDVASADYLEVVGELPGPSLINEDLSIEFPENESVYVQEVLSQSLLLKSDWRLLRAKRAELKSEKTSRFPEVYIEAGASWNDNLDGVSGRNNDAFLMLRMEYDLFDGGVSKAKLANIGERYTQLEYDGELNKRLVLKEAQQAWYAFQSSQRRASLLSDYVEAAERTKAAYVKQFNIGSRSLIDLLDAENELLQARRMYSDANFEQQLTGLKLLELDDSLVRQLGLVAGRESAYVQ